MSTRLILNLAALALPACALASEPSFDCAKAATDTETAVCESEHLARLDHELARLYKLALDGPSVGEDRAGNLRAMQRGWIKGRDDCWKAGDKLPACVTAAYVLRIDELRTGYADARDDDANGISHGPLAYACDELGALVSAVFVNADPAVVSLRWAETGAVLIQAEAASGAKYTAQNPSEPLMFWTHGDEAMLQLSGDDNLHCQIEPTG